MRERAASIDAPSVQKILTQHAAAIEEQRASYERQMASLMAELQRQRVAPPYIEQLTQLNGSLEQVSRRLGEGLLPAATRRTRDGHRHCRRLLHLCCRHYRYHPGFRRQPPSCPPPSRPPLPPSTGCSHHHHYRPTRAGNGTRGRAGGQFAQQGAGRRAWLGRRRQPR